MEDSDEERDEGAGALTQLFSRIAESFLSGPRSPLTKAEHDPAKEERWGPGPWCEEPDHVEWTVYDLPCVIDRSASLGAWRGYVGVGPGHPWYRVPGEDIAAVAHSGITWSGSLEFVELSILKPSPDTWWVGFHASHAWDLVPAWVASRSYELLENNGAKYRTAQYCVLQVIGLAWQATMAAQAAAEVRDRAKSNA